MPGLPDSAPSALEAASQADAVCLPTPAIASGAVTGLPDLTPAQLLSALPPDTVVFGGGLGTFRSLLQRTDTPYYDMLQNPALALANASVTAEGAILLALQAMPITLHQKMDYVYCGKSGLKLPEVSLGFWHNFGDTGVYENMKQICFTAFDNGITHFDLANNYGPEPDKDGSSNLYKAIIR